MRPVPTPAIRLVWNLVTGSLELVAVAYAFPVAILVIGIPLVLLVGGSIRAADAIWRLAFR